MPRRTGMFGFAATIGLLIVACAAAWAATASWRIVPTPNPGANGSILLSAADAPQSATAWAVGYSANGQRWSPLAERWNGSAWKVTPTPPLAGQVVLHRVIAPTSGTAYAVGFTLRGPKRQLPVAERWTGSKWQSMSAPQAAPVQSTLESAAQLHNGTLIAVGYYANAKSVSRPLVETYQSGKWRIVRPAAPAGDQMFEYVSAVPGTDTAWAVGVGIIDRPRTLTEFWNGTSWKQVAAVNPTTGLTALSAVDAVSPTDVWAVGQYTPNPLHSIRARPLIEHWNGSSWKVVANPSPGKGNAELESITTAADGSLWAVGQRRQGSQFETLTEHWDGTKWTIVPSPNTSDHYNILNGVAGGPAGVWAVGNSQAGHMNRALVEGYR